MPSKKRFHIAVEFVCAEPAARRWREFLDMLQAAPVEADKYCMVEVILHHRQCFLGQKNDIAGVRV